MRTWLGRALAWVLRDPFEEFLQRANRYAEELTQAEARRVDELRHELLVVQQGIGAALEQLGRDQQALSGAIQQLQVHVETRLNQLGREVGDVGKDNKALAQDMQALAEQALPTVQQRLETVEDRFDTAVRALQTELERLRDQRVQQLEAAQAAQHKATVALTAEVEGLRDQRVPQLEGTAEQLHKGLQALVREVECVRDERLPATVQRLDALAGGVASVQALAEELRDSRLPALAARLDALVGRLHEELAQTAGLVDRMLAGEPLLVNAPEELEGKVPAAILAASRAFADAFRGSEEEISARVVEHLELLRQHAPVLDCGCGRGELLRQLLAAGVEAWGVDTDPAMVAACRRAGLAVREGDAVAVLADQAPASLGAVVALHLVEHLAPAKWMCLVEAAARALQPGGILLIESPNPQALRVGADLFWIDPTHRAPVHPEALAFVARAVGLRVESVRFVHPFPPEQRLARQGQTAEVRTLAEQLDAWLSAPRDFVLVASRAATTSVPPT